MGMFDDLKCDYPIPDAHMQDAAFQTKSFDCDMTQYVVTAEGLLIHHGIESYLVPPEERPYYDPEIKGFKNEIDELCGSWGSRGEETIAHHGDVYFYTSVGWFADGVKTYAITQSEGGRGRRVSDGPWEPARYEWFEYCARFTNGRVEWIKRVPDPDDTEPSPDLSLGTQNEE